METIVENRSGGIQVIYGVVYRQSTNEEIYEAQIRSAIPRKKVPVVQWVQVRVNKAPIC